MSNLFNCEFVPEPQTRDRRAKFEIWLAAFAKELLRHGGKDEDHACYTSGTQLGCLAGSIMPYFGISGYIKFLGDKIEIFNWDTEGDGDIEEALNDLLDEFCKVECYLSITYVEFGWGECPYKRFRISVEVTDGGKLVAGARVNNEKDTYENGIAEVLVSSGKQAFYASKDGKTGLKEINIDGRKKVTIILGEQDEITNGNAVVQVCADSYGNSCAIVTKDGRLYRWGKNDVGQIGNST